MAELTSLEDELEFPRQELESQKKEEQTRRKNVGRFRKEIQVNYLHDVWFLKEGGCLGVRL